jgi:hypothetical protein
MMLGAELVDLSTFARLLIRIALLYSDNLHQEHRKKKFWDVCSTLSKLDNMSGSPFVVWTMYHSTLCRVDNVSFDILLCEQCIIRHYVVWTMYHSTLCHVDNVLFDIMSCGQCIVRHYICHLDNVSFDIMSGAAKVLALLAGLWVVGSNPAWV